MLFHCAAPNAGVTRRKYDDECEWRMKKKHINPSSHSCKMIFSVFTANFDIFN
jgi:hypothetical protein